MHPLKTFRWPLGFTVLAIVLSAVLGSLEMALIVTLLAILEISISFDNAVVNAAVLKTMTRKWQQIFLTWGILIAVFGMRLVFPIVIVAVAAGMGVVDVIDLAINEQDQYAAKLEESYPVIASFGGVFLFMVFLNFFFDEDKDHHWLIIEKPLAKVGHIEGITAAMASIALLVVSKVVAAPEHELDVLVAGLVGLVCYLLSNGAAGALEESMEDEIEMEHEIEERARREHPEDPNRAAAAALEAAAKGGFASFLYLELLDASFSFDGVIGAFAITTDIVIIAIGLGLGALYIRTLTVYLVRQGTLSEYRYLEHGAHWAIGILAVLLFVGIEHHVPEVITGTLGASLILVSFLWSIRANKKDAAAGVTRDIESSKANI